MGDTMHVHSHFSMPPSPHWSTDTHFPLPHVPVCRGRPWMGQSAHPLQVREGWRPSAFYKIMKTPIATPFPVGSCKSLLVPVPRPHTKLPVAFAVGHVKNFCSELFSGTLGMRRHQAPWLTKPSSKTGSHCPQPHRLPVTLSNVTASSWLKNPFFPLRQEIPFPLDQIYPLMPKCCLSDSQVCMLFISHYGGKGPKFTRPFIDQEYEWSWDSITLCPLWAFAVNISGLQKEWRDRPWR